MLFLEDIAAGRLNDKTVVDMRAPLRGLLAAARGALGAMETHLTDVAVYTDFDSTLPHIPASATIAAAQKGKAAKAKFEQETGKKFINVSLGQPDFPAPDGLVDNAITYFKSRFKNFNYTNTEGDEQVVAAVKEFIKEQYFSREQTAMEGQGVCLTNGAKEALTFLFKALGNNKTFIVPTPGWVSYEAEIENAQGVPMMVPCSAESGYKMTPAQLRDIAEKNPTAVLLLNNPSNPTGAVYNSQELEALAEVIRDFPFMAVVEDAIYNRVTAEGSRPPLLAALAPDLKNRCAQILGAAKDGSLASERVAFFKAPLQWYKNAVNFKSNLSGNTPVTVQAFAHAYVTGNYDAHIAACNVEYRQRFNLVQEKLQELGISCADADGAFYAFPSIADSPMKGATVTLRDDSEKTINDGNDFFEYLLDMGIGATPGAPFGKGYEDNIRLSCATSTQDIKEMLERVYAGCCSATMATGENVGVHLSNQIHALQQQAR